MKLNYNLLKENYHLEPFPHILIKNLISQQEAIEITNDLLQNYTWTKDDMTADIEWIEHLENSFDIFYENVWLSNLFPVFGLDTPNKIKKNQSVSKLNKGAYLNVHNDGPDSTAWRSAKKRYKSVITGCLVQQMYFTNSLGHKDSGMWLHDKNHLPIKQIPCLPGTYIAYVSSDYCYHSVPVQQHQFDRLLLNCKTWW